MDFLTVPTARVRVLYVVIMLSRVRRRVVHFNVTEHPTAQWIAQQLVEAFPFDFAPHYLLRDRDAIYGDLVKRRIRGLGIEEVITAPHSPRQDPFVERVLGSIRRDCLDHVIVFNERAPTQDSSRVLRLQSYLPDPRAVEPVEFGNILALPYVEGHHHRYSRVAA